VSLFRLITSGVVIEKLVYYGLPEQKIRATIPPSALNVLDRPHDVDRTLLRMCSGRAKRAKPVGSIPVASHG